MSQRDSEPAGQWRYPADMVRRGAAVTMLSVALLMAACGSGRSASKQAGGTSTTSASTPVTDATSTSTPATSPATTATTTPAKPASTTTTAGKATGVVEIPAARARAASGGVAGAQPAANAMAAFGATLYQQLRAGSTGNLVISPVSIATVFAMVTAGAQGTTADQLSNVFHVSGSDADQQSVNSLLQELAARNRPPEAGNGMQVTLRVANDLWTQAGFRVEAPFLQRLGASYGAGLHQVDFTKTGDVDQARRQINSSVSQTTNGRIPELFGQGSLDASTRVVLVNALYLLGSWSAPFAPSATAPAPFTRIDGSKVQVPFMHGEQGAYAAGAGWQAVKLPIYGGQLSVDLILPDAGRFDEVERNLGPDLLAQARRPQPGGPAVQLSLPKFKVDTSLELSKALQQLGAVDAFRNANFDGISKGAGLYISVVAHKTYVGVDENGIEAAAATGVGMATSAPLKVIDVRFDRPFLVAVVDEPTGTPLFMGRIVDPS